MTKKLMTSRWKKRKKLCSRCLDRWWAGVGLVAKEPKNQTQCCKNFLKAWGCRCQRRLSELECASKISSINITNQNLRKKYLPQSLKSRPSSCSVILGPKACLWSPWVVWLLCWHWHLERILRCSAFSCSWAFVHQNHCSKVSALWAWRCCSPWKAS